SGHDASRVFAISGGVTATLARLTITHGKASQGAGIENAGNLSLNDAVLSDNHAVGGMGGGGISNEAGANLTVHSSALIDNTATAAAASDVFGGGILNQGSADVTSSAFVENVAEGGAGSAFLGSQGGAIDNFGSAMLSVSDTAFINNQALGADGP